MYKLIIVDDEKEIRQGLSEFIDWCEIGFELISSFEDGKEAIEFLEKNDVDIVFTDILMAEVSGLELAEYIYKNKPEVKVVIISGYKEFEYAKKALEFNVENYLLKPTDIDQVIEVFTKIREKLDRDNEARFKQKEMQKRYKEIVPILEEQFFSDLLAGGMGNGNQMKKRISSVGLGIDPDLNRCMIVELDLTSLNNETNKKWIHGKERLHIAIRNFFRFSRDGLRYYPIFGDNCLKVIVIAQEDANHTELPDQLKKHLDEVLETIRKILGLDISISGSHYFNSLTEMSKYREPVRIKYNDTDRDNNYDFEPEIYQQLVQKYKLFVSVIIDGDNEALISLGERYLEEISDLPVRFVQRLVNDLFTIIFNKLHEMGFKFDKFIFEKTDYLNIVKIADIVKIKTFVTEGLSCLSEYAASQRKNTVEVSISRAVKFIEKNYNRDISLDDAANEVFLNTVYFSRLFKQQTGENFTDYLTRVRMEKAKQLICMGKYKTYEISSMVGYSSSKYFSRVFKLYTGYTPKDYFCFIVRGDLKNEE